MKIGAGSFSKVRPLFIGSNIIVTCIIFAFFIVIVIPSIDPYPVALAGSIALSSLSIILATSLISYGCLLTRAMARGASHASAGSGSNHSAKTSNLPVHLRILILGIWVSTCLIIESVMWLLSILDNGSGDKEISRTGLYTGLFYLFDVLMLIAVLWAFRRTISEGAMTGLKLRSSASRSSQGISMVALGEHTPRITEAPSSPSPFISEGPRGGGGGQEDNSPVTPMSTQPDYAYHYPQYSPQNEPHPPSD